MVLWSVGGTAPQALAVVEDELSIEDDRQSRMMYATMYTDFYTGPITVRRFLVVHEGIQSSYRF